MNNCPRSSGGDDANGDPRRTTLSRRAFIVAGVQTLALLAACAAPLPVPPTATAPVSAGGSPAPSAPPISPSPVGTCVAPAVVAPTPVPYPGYTQVEPSTGLHVTGPAQLVDLDSYRLEVTGLVDHPLSLSYDDLRCLPKVEAHVRLECPGFFADEVNLAGVTFASVIALAGPQPGAKSVRVASVEDYSMGFTLNEIQAEDNFLAYQWGDQPLPASHGFPLRGVMPTRAGSNWVKWVRQLELS
jgi:DMSO/TMAO reductase YedYZ molybdopterin-dependent catalytic subunit